jgi:hypothetical protein
LGWLAIGWLNYDVDCTLGNYHRQMKATESATVDAQLRLAGALDDWRVFRAWLASHPAEAPLVIPDGVYLLEHYLHVHGVPDAECQCECGSRECEGCGVNGCNGGWQMMRWFGRAHDLSGWMFYEVLGSDVDLAETWGEAVTVFDAALAAVNWYEDKQPSEVAG